MNMFKAIDEFVADFHNKLGVADARQWETVLRLRNRRSFKIIERLPSPNIDDGYIDVELVEGSKTANFKSPHNWLAVSFEGLWRTLFLPLSWTWWRQAVDSPLQFFVLHLYIIQVLFLVIHAFNGDSLTDPGSCLFAMLLLGVLYTHVVKAKATQMIKSPAFAAYVHKDTSPSRTTVDPVIKVALATTVEENDDSLVHPAEAEYDEEESNNKCAELTDVGEQTDPSGSPSESSDRAELETEGVEKAQVAYTPTDEGDEVCGSSADVADRFPLVMPKSSHGRLLPPTQVTFFEEVEVKEDERRLILDSSSSSQVRPRTFHVSRTGSFDSLEGSGGLRSPLADLSGSARFPLADVNGNARIPLAPEHNPQTSTRSSPSLAWRQQHMRPNHNNLRNRLSSAKHNPRSYTSDTSEWASDTADADESSSSDDGEPGPTPVAANVSVNASNEDTHVKLSCIIWDEDGCKKVEQTLGDLGFAIINRVQRCSSTSGYIIPAMLLSLAFCLSPILHRTFTEAERLSCSNSSVSLNDTNLTDLYKELRYFRVSEMVKRLHLVEAVTLFLSCYLRLCYAVVGASFLCAAEADYKKRLLLAKHFGYLTSAYKAQRHELPHFRLTKVRNIKTWLSLRAQVKRLAAQRSIDLIVSFSFFAAAALLAALTVVLLHDTSRFLSVLAHWDILVWLLIHSLFTLRFMTLGGKVHRKYRNCSVLLTEQINLHLKMEEKPTKRDQLQIAHSVLKLAEQLIKEVESPFKLSGLVANPYLYSITKVVLLSGFSAVATELLGFKLKLHKLKLE